MFHNLCLYKIDIRNISRFLNKYKQVTVCVNACMHVETGKCYLNVIDMTTKNVWNANDIGLSFKGGLFIEIKLKIWYTVKYFYNFITSMYVAWFCGFVILYNYYSKHNDTPYFK